MCGIIANADRVPFQHDLWASRSARAYIAERYVYLDANVRARDDNLRREDRDRDMRQFAEDLNFARAV